MKMKILPLILLVTLTGFLMVISCKYDEVLPPEPDPGEIISFSEDIIPIFNASCSTAGCHTSGGIAPDLRPEVAYEALTLQGYVNTAQPEESELYLWMNGSKAFPMPLTGVNATYVSTVLQWIEQGALNN